MNQISMLFILFFAVAAVFASTAEAQNKNTKSYDCVAAIEAGDIDTVRKLAAEMLEWENLFSLIVRRNAEKCIKTATGKDAVYSRKLGRFVTVEEAEAIAAENQAELEIEQAVKLEAERTSCELFMAERKVDSLEAEKERFQQQRITEARLKTLQICGDIYTADASKALLEPVCNDLFVKIGLPDTDYPFDEAELSLARLALLNIRLSSDLVFSELVEAQETEEAEKQNKFLRCQELLAR